MGANSRRLTRCMATVVAAAICAAAGDSHAESKRFHSVELSHIYVEYLTIPIGSTVDYHVAGLSPGADPVIHLLGEDGAAGFVQVASHDDLSPSNPEAQIVFYNFTPFEDFLLVVRAKDSDAAGWAALLRNGSPYQFVPIGGVDFAINDPSSPRSLDTYSGDQLRTILQPGGSVEQIAFAFSDPAGLQLRAIDLASGIGGAVVLQTTAGDDFFMVGTPYVRLDGQNTAYRTGDAIVANNYPASWYDFDSDGVGSSLEIALETCHEATGCPNAHHGRDTDHDGLSDGEELWGVEGMVGNGLDDIPLSRWGADPRHKDAFVEVDYITPLTEKINPGTLDGGENPFQWMRDHPGQSITTYNAGNGGNTPALPEDFFNRVQGPYAAAPNDHVHNPDGQDGIRLHLDLGVAPADRDDEDKFGDYSTNASRAIVEDWKITISDPDPSDGDPTPFSGWVWVVVNNSWFSVDITNRTVVDIIISLYFGAMATNEPIRFKSLSISPDSSSATLTLESSTAGLHFDRGLHPPYQYADSFKVSLETDGSLRAHYYDDDHVDAVRRGVMRYAVISRGGQALDARFVAGLSTTFFAHELGHTFELDHWGHDDWGHPHVDCLAHYPSLMTYGGAETPGQPLQFSSEDSALVLNPARTLEVQTFGSGYDQSRFIQEPRKYPAPPSGASATDFSRDGWIAPAGSRWRTMALNHNGFRCHTFSVGRRVLESGEVLTGPVDIVRQDTYLRLLWPTSAGVRMRWTPLGSQAKSCTGSANPHPNGTCFPGMTSAETLIAVAPPDPVLGVSAATEGSEMYVAYTQGGSIKVASFFTTTGGAPVASGNTWTIAPSDPQHRPAGAPELVRLHDSGNQGALGLLYLAQNETFRHHVFDDIAGVWNDAGPMRDGAGNTIAGAIDPAAKAWPDDAPWAATEKRTVAILPDSNTRLRAFVLNPAGTSNRWVLSNAAGGDTTRKPFLEYRTIRDETGAAHATLPGHFLIGSHGANGSPYVRVSDYHDRWLPPGGGAALAYGVVENYLHDNGVATTLGSAAAMYSDSTIDNVFALVPTATKLEFYPHADGSPDSDFKVYSDFRVIEDTTCDVISRIRNFGCKAVYVFD